MTDNERNNRKKYNEQITKSEISAQSQSAGVLLNQQLIS